MSKALFTKKLSSLSKSACKEVICATGLRYRDERILLEWYVYEKSINKIAEEECIQRESAYNALAQARSRLYFLLTHQLELLPDDVKRIAKYLV
ncbi:MAG: hypothetical protein IKK97_03770 [Phascolarctobacterium sp.]|nr:hypothetical protein [Phascolarctobacterium sp.]